MRRFPLLVLLLTLGLAAPAQGKALKAIWGPITLPNGKSAGPTYRAIGLDVLQLSITWRAIASSRPATPTDPADPAYSWDSQVDEAVALGRKYGFKVAVLVTNAPGWANGGNEPRYAPKRPKDFRDFMYAASQRYPGVRRWMIWGEPGRISNFKPNERNSPVGPRAYAKVLDAAYAGLKAASRRNVVVGGMTFTTGDVVPRDFIKWLRLPNGKPPRLDQWGHNPFSTRRPDMRLKPFSDGNYDFSDMDTLYTKVWRLYRKHYPRFRKTGPRIWVSEFTIQSEHGSQDFNYFVSLQDQGEWVSAAFIAANKKPYIANVGWLGLLDEPPSSFNRTTGLLRYNLAKKPSYRAFKAAP